MGMTDRELEIAIRDLPEKEPPTHRKRQHLAAAIANRDRYPLGSHDWTLWDVLCKRLCREIELEHGHTGTH